MEAGKSRKKLAHTPMKEVRVEAKHQAKFGMLKSVDCCRGVGFEVRPDGGEMFFKL